MTLRGRQIAVLGSGIMGSSVALFLARQGANVTIIDAMEKPFHGASRWNEGKIHLGYLYSASGSLSTAEKLLPGGLAFKELTEELVGCSLTNAATQDDDHYLVHRNSVVDADNIARYMKKLDELIASHPDADKYFARLTKKQSQSLTRAELETDYLTGSITAGFRVPEHSIPTQWLADRFVNALQSEPRIQFSLGTRVISIQRLENDKLIVLFEEGRSRPFDMVINALWEGRLAVDASMGIAAPQLRSHRFRLSVFLRTTRAVSTPCAVVCAGPFGDIKNYNGTDHYLSWYPAGLIAEGNDIHPPVIPALNEQQQAQIIEDVFMQLGGYIKGMENLKNNATEMVLQGGWVYASGQGSLGDPASTIHRRDQIGIHRTGNYISVDTGKYSIAPWLARKIVDSLL